jgi:hypothetical protein
MVPRKVSIGVKHKHNLTLTPGPTSYNVNPEVSATLRKSPVAKIGTTKRVEIFVGKEDIPGPA